MYSMIKTQRCREDTKQDQSPIQSTDLYKLLIPLYTIIIVHNTVWLLVGCVVQRKNVGL